MPITSNFGFEVLLSLMVQLRFLLSCAFVEAYMGGRACEGEKVISEG